MTLHTLQCTASRPWALAVRPPVARPAPCICISNLVRRAVKPHHWSPCRCVVSRAPVRVGAHLPDPQETACRACMQCTVASCVSTATAGEAEHIREDRADDVCRGRSCTRKARLYEVLDIRDGVGQGAQVHLTQCLAVSTPMPGRQHGPGGQRSMILGPCAPGAYCTTWDGREQGTFHVSSKLDWR